MRQYLIETRTTTNNGIQNMFTITRAIATNDHVLSFDNGMSITELQRDTSKAVLVEAAKNMAVRNNLEFPAFN